MEMVQSKASSATKITNARDIPDLTKAEALEVSLIEVQRVVELLEQLEDDDWNQPTDCTEWTVRDIAAHLSGACAGWSTWKHFRRQYLFNPYTRKGEDRIHGINRCEVADRADFSTEEIIAEMREYGPKAVRMRQRIPGFIRHLEMPLPPLGKAPIHYLLDTIYPRDQWMHRADICRAAGKQMIFTKEYDERVTDLVMLDIAKRLEKKIAGTVDLMITGGVEKTYRFGDKSSADAGIVLDLLELNRLASQRATPEETREVCSISGDKILAIQFLENCEAGY